MKNKVVLIYPAYSGPPLGPPLSLLSLASPLMDAGFEVSIIDSALTENVESALTREIQGAVCVGISFLTGPMINGAIALSRLARRLCPDIPVIFGGWHSSLLPEETLASGHADIVVRNQGERTLVELASRLRDGKSIDGVSGISFRAHDTIVNNPVRPPDRIDGLPSPAFSLSNFDAYERLTGARKLPFASSLGCPYACNYCTDQVFYDRKFNAYSAERVVTEVTGLVSRHRLRQVALLDSNFPVSVKRALEIARGFIDSPVKFNWTFQASTDLVCRMSDEEVGLLGASGVDHVGFGTESASDEVLALMNKKHQRVGDMYEAARKTKQAGIAVTFNLIFGYPGETESDRLETFRIMSDISRQHSNVSFSPNVFTPYPGLHIWPQLEAMGVPQPRSLEGWADVDLGCNRLPWLQGDDLRRLRRMLEYFLLAHRLRQSGPGHTRWRERARNALGVPLRWRIDNNAFGMPWELWLSRARARIIARRSLLTGTPLSDRIREVC